jgi:uncharacterized protein YcfL
MKKLSYLLVVFALFSFIALSSCKSSTKKPEAPQEEVMEESTSQPDSASMMDSTAADTSSMDQEAQ